MATRTPSDIGWDQSRRKYDGEEERERSLVFLAVARLYTGAENWPLVVHVTVRTGITGR
jgi:hypothetical protein